MNSKEYFNRLNDVIQNLPLKDIDTAVSIIKEKWINGNQIITCGNGGSSLTALHYINDWNKSIYLSTKKPFYGRTLIDNIGLVMSYSNDISFEDLFLEQLKNILKPSDLLIAISGSGNSKNVINAINYANEQNATTLSLTGYSGGELMKVSQHNIHVNVNDMQLCEDIHAIFGHIVMRELCSTTIP